MKKYFILAATALVAMCACTKTTVNELPEKTIAFNVASYVPQTKATTYSSILTETERFHTFAFYHVNGGAAQAYFTANGEEITPDSIENPTKWAPSHVYYWPKTGSINFYSYYGTQDPTVTDGSLTYADKTIGGSDNIAFADPAFCQTANKKPATYGTSGATEGVPTLFHHALCQIAFDAKVTKFNDKSTDWAEGDDYTEWEVTINAANLVVDNKGTLTLSKAIPAETADPSTPKWLENYDVVGWVPATSTETIIMRKADDASDDVKLTKTTDDTGAGDSILALRSAMPQTIDDTNLFSITYTIKTTRSWDPENPAVEVVTPKDPIKLSDFDDALASWNMNKKITYHIIIDPVEQQILFDPAVEDMVAVDGGTVTLPLPATTTGD